MTTTHELSHHSLDAWVPAQAKYQAHCAESLFGIDGFANSLHFVFDNRGYRAYGGIHSGRPYVKLSKKSAKARLDRNITRFKEYGSIADHSVIGTYDNGKVEAALICEILHEIAHAIDYWTMRDEDLMNEVDAKINLNAFPIDGRTSDKGGHGQRWKAIYAVLRAGQLNGGYTVAPAHVEEKVSKPKRAYSSAVKHIKLHFASGSQKRRYFLDDDKDGRFTLLAMREAGRKTWVTYLSDGRTGSKIHMMNLEDGRKLRMVAKTVIESAYEKIAQRAA
jgi:hypothetical protein